MKTSDVQTIATVADLLTALQRWPLDTPVAVQFDYDTRFRITDVRITSLRTDGANGVVVIEAA